MLYWIFSLSRGIGFGVSSYGLKGDIKQHITVFTLSIIWKQFQKYTKTLKKIFPNPKLLLVFSYSSIWIPKYKENKDFWNVNYKKRRNFDIQGITKKLYLRP